ncbi:Guanosine-diphosphatase [Rhizina undulata]
MSNVRRRPSLWSYFSFQRPHQRSSSISSVLRPSDSHEKRRAEPTSGIMSTRYVKIVTVIVIVALALFLLAPGERRESVSKFVGDYKAHASTPSGTTSDTSSFSSNSGQSPIDPAITTTKCTKSSSKSKPLIQYALMVDAGSTGSRIHVYRFNNCGETPELEEEVFKMIKPGLSSYPDDPEAAAKSLDDLMEEAVKTVPDKLKSCTPVAVKATAGLRILGNEKSGKILEAVRHRLETAYPFPVVAGDGVSIMDGKDEGVYAWITTNYLLSKIGTADSTPTAAIFDLGGGSTQIVFQPTFPSVSGGMPAVLAAGDHKYDLTFGGRHFSLYQHSHLGYGLMEARKSIHKLILSAYLSTSDAAPRTLTNPCISPGMFREIEVEVSNDQKVKVNMTGPSIPAPAQCRFVAEQILKKETECPLAPCSFNGIHQPSLQRTFATEDVYIFSYFYDRTRPLGMPDSFTLKELRDVTEKVCAGESAWDVFSGIEGALEELRDRPEYCLDLNFMMALLHTGYEMPLDREVRIAKKIKGNELGWCLGASLPLLEAGSGWKCRVKEVA